MSFLFLVEFKKNNIGKYTTEQEKKLTWPVVQKSHARNVGVNWGRVWLMEKRAGKSSSSSLLCFGTWQLVSVQTGRSSWTSDTLAN